MKLGIYLQEVNQIFKRAASIGFLSQIKNKCVSGNGSGNFR